MLFRRCAAYSFIAFLIVIASATANDKLDGYRKQGQKMSAAFIPLSPQEIEAITPNEVRGQTFDGEKAKSQLTAYQQIEAGKNEIDPMIQAMIENSERTMTTRSGHEETIEKCLLENVLTSVEIRHDLSVRLNHVPEVGKTVKICKGHRKEKKSSDPKREKKKIKKRLSNDSSIKKYDVYIDDQSIGHRDIVVSKWIHHDDTSSCNHFSEEEKISSEKWEEVDIWIVDDPKRLDSPDCTIISIETGLPETRLIDGQAITRPYWSKIHHLKCYQQQQQDCDFLKNKQCVQVNEKCLKHEGGRCVSLEKTFKCTNPFSRGSFDLTATYGTDPSLWNTDYQPNQGFADASTKLAVFDELKKELVHSKTADVRSVRLFSGSLDTCSVNVAENLVYDCCFDMGGLSTTIKLSRCTSDEIALAESRAKGLCHYVGKKKEKLLGLWTSRKEHVFCTFPSKLSRVFQEEARKQLDIGWGDAEKPDCRGLTQEEIKKLDFSRLNLMEAFEVPKQKDHTDRIKHIEERLKTRLEETACS